MAMPILAPGLSRASLRSEENRFQDRRATAGVGAARIFAAAKRGHGGGDDDRRGVHWRGVCRRGRSGDAKRVDEVADLRVRLHLELRSDERLVDSGVRERAGAIARRGKRIEKSQGASGAERIERDDASPVRYAVLIPAFGGCPHGRLANGADDGLMESLPLTICPPLELIESVDGEAVEERTAIDRVGDVDPPIANGAVEVP